MQKTVFLHSVAYSNSHTVTSMREKCFSCIFLHFLAFSCIFKWSQSYKHMQKILAFSWIFLDFLAFLNSQTVTNMREKWLFCIFWHFLEFFAFSCILLIDPQNFFWGGGHHQGPHPYYILLIQVQINSSLIIRNLLRIFLQLAPQTLA